VISKHNKRRQNENENNKNKTPTPTKKTKQKDAGVGFLRVFLFSRVDFLGVFFYNKEKEHTAGSQERKRERAICDDGMTRDDDENSNRIISNSLSLFSISPHYITHAPLPWIQL
jgi:hypothetical protein